MPSAAKQGISKRDCADWSNGYELSIISHGMLSAADIWVGGCRPQICHGALWGNRLLSWCAESELMSINHWNAVGCCHHG